MPITAKKTGGEFEKLPAGTIQAICVNVIDLGIEQYSYQGEEKSSHKIIVLWECDKRYEQGEWSGKRFLISKKYTLSLNEKANLRKDLESWRGRAFTEDELNGFDVEKLVNASCLLGIVHNQANNGNIYANISAVSPLMANMNPLTRETPEGYLPEWIKNKLPSQAGMINDVMNGGNPFDESIPF